MKIQKSSEDYLESMLMLKEKNGFVRAIDVSVSLGVSKPSVSYATKRLRENGYITIADDGHIELTQSGYAIANRIYNRHKKLTDFLVCLGVDAETARNDACKIEHDMSDKTFEALCAHVEKLGKK